MSNETITSLIERLKALGVSQSTLNSLLLKMTGSGLRQLHALSFDDARRVLFTLRSWLQALEQTLH